MKISNDTAQKYIDGTLSSTQTSELQEIFESDQSYRLLGKILKAGKEYKSPNNSNEFNTVSFEQIDNILLECLNGNISQDNLDDLVVSINHEFDFLEKLLTRIESNVSATVESENVNLEKINILTDEQLLKTMNIDQKDESKKDILVKLQDFLKRTFKKVNEFIHSFNIPINIPQPAYTLIALVLIVSTFFVGAPIYTEYQSNSLTNKSLAYLLDNYSVSEDMPRPSGGFDFSIFGVTRSSTREKEDEALTLLKEAIEFDDENSKAHQLLGTWYLLNLQFESAEENYQKALELNPDDATILNDLGQLAFIQENYTLAEGYFNKALTFNPQLPEVHFNLGLIYEKQGKLDEAKMEWEKYLDMDSTSKWSTIIKRNLKRIQP